MPAAAVWLGGKSGCLMHVYHEMDTETQTLINGQHSKPNQGLNNAESGINFDPTQFQPRVRDRHISYGSINGVCCKVLCWLLRLLANWISYFTGSSSTRKQSGSWNARTANCCFQKTPPRNAYNTLFSVWSIHFLSNFEFCGLNFIYCTELRLWTMWK